MLEPVNKNETPPGGYKYTDPRTGMKFDDNSIFGIYPRVSRAWFANDIEFPDNWKAVIDHEICEQNPQMESREIGVPERVLTFQDVERFASSVKKWLEKGAQFVSSEEAERRAAICAKCQFNKPLRMCFGCTKTLTWVAERAGWPQTSRDSELQGCVICGCVLKLKCQLPLEAIDNAGIENWPSHCWQSTTPS